MLDIQIKHMFPDSKFSMNLSLSLKCTGITAISGPSGSGKSTLLRAIAGLLKPDLGHIYFNQEVWQDNDNFIPTHKRFVAYVFQEGSLLPHLNGLDNINYGLKRSQLKSKSVNFDEVIEVLGIKNQLSQLPDQMSGGERQRVAIASAVIRGAKVLLMDEPLASLDSERKQKLISYFNKIKSNFDIPIIYVTHSIDEIHSLADRIILMDNGSIHNQDYGTDVNYLLQIPLTIKLDSKDSSNINVSEHSTGVLRMIVRVDQCLLFKQKPTSTDKSVVIEVIVDSIKESSVLLNYHSQIFNFPTTQKVNVGQTLWLLCANPQIK